MGERTRDIWTKECSSRGTLNLHHPQALRTHHRALVYTKEMVTGRIQERVCLGDHTVWLWFLCTTMLPAHPATRPQQMVTHMSVVSFVILGEKRSGRDTSCLLTAHWGQPQPPAAHLETVQPVAHVDEALLGGDVVHEHHAVRLAQQLPSHAVVPAQRVRAG